jgi:hypothetical protein
MKETRERIARTPFVEVRDSRGRFMYVEMAPGKEHMGKFILGGKKKGKPIIDKLSDVSKMDHSLYAITCREAGMEECKGVRVTWEGTRMRTLEERTGIKVPIEVPARSVRRYDGPLPF